MTSRSMPSYYHAAVLISYAYYEKDEQQKSNMEFFIQAGGLPSPTQQHIMISFVVATDICSPCRDILPSTT